MKRSISPLRRLALAASALMGLTTAAPALAGAVDTTWTQDRDVARMVSLGGSCTRCELSGRDLSGATLTGANFAYATLVGANLRGAELVGSNFVGADFSTPGWHELRLYHYDSDERIGVSVNWRDNDRSPIDPRISLDRFELDVPRGRLRLDAVQLLVGAQE